MEKNVYSELELEHLKKQAYTLMYKKNDNGMFKMYQTVTLRANEFDCLADNYSKVTTKIKEATGEKNMTSTTGKNLKIDDTDQNDRLTPIKTAAVKTARMKKITLAKMSSGVNSLSLPVLFNRQID